MVNMGPTWALSAPDGPHEPCYQIGWSLVKGSTVYALPDLKGIINYSLGFKTYLSRSRWKNLPEKGFPINIRCCLPSPMLSGVEVIYWCRLGLVTNGLVLANPGVIRAGDKEQTGDSRCHMGLIPNQKKKYHFTEYLTTDLSTLTHSQLSVK